MWYISFHGGSNAINNILVYHDSGKQHSQPNVLPTGGFDPELKELRGFLINENLLYVVNGYKEYNQILLYIKDGNSGYAFKEVFASNDMINSILHPYDLTFDTLGNCYVSSQDTNVVTGLQGTNSPLGVAFYLQEEYPPPNIFLAGTIVASSMGELPNTPTPYPPDVPTPQGLDVNFTDSTDSRVAHSVRGVLFFNGFLYVADEPGNSVNIYDSKTGKLHGQIMGDNLSAPVQLLLSETTGVLYIGSTGTDSVLSYDLSQETPSETVVPNTFIDGKVKHISGMDFDADGNFYAAERKAKKIKMFPPDGSGKGKDFIKDLPDNPEFIRYVPKK